MRTYGGAGAAVLLALVLAACGSPSASKASGSDAALLRIKNAVERTEAAGTAHLVTDSVTKTASSQGSGSKSQQSHLTTVGDIEFAGPDLALSTTTQSGSTSPSGATAIYVGKHLYLNASPPGGPWVKEPYREPYPYLGAVQAEALTAATGPVTVVGTRDLDGRTTTEYSIPMPGSTTTEPLTNDNNQPYTEEIRIAPFVLSVLLDADGRIVRTQATLVATVSGTPHAAVEQTTTNLSDFGEAVHIAAPARTLES